MRSREVNMLVGVYPGCPRQGIGHGRGFLPVGFLILFYGQAVKCMEITLG